MELDSNLYLHNSDKAALSALKAIPGFSQIMKAFMKIWNEQQFKLANMSTNLRIGPNQMKKYYDMLPPICEKLGIQEPEIYVKLDVYPNAYTYGDTNPFIVLTSGLFETMPDELIPTVIAHECGHIACHHSLYTTIGRLIMNSGALVSTGLLGNIAMLPIQLAFSYWMRCSEFSADRAAIICDGTSEKIVEMCMRFAGCDKDIQANYSVDSFIDQAKEYKELLENSAWNKTLEFIMYSGMDHPLNAVRAYEGREWAKGERFSVIMDYVNNPSEKSRANLPVWLKPKNLIGKKQEEAQSALTERGFSNVCMARTTENPGKAKSGEVFSITIDGKEDPPEEYYRREAQIAVTYYEDKTAEEIASEHPGEVLLEESSKFFLGKDFTEVHEQLRGVGFSNVTDKEMALPKFGRRGKEKTVAKIIIGDMASFEKNTWFMPDTPVVLYYYVKVD